MPTKLVREPNGNTVDIEANDSLSVEAIETEDDGNDIEDDDESIGQRDHLSRPITLHLSRSLIRKLQENSRDEGVTMEELAAELVAEGVVLRAWEIVERKATMRGGTANQGNQNNFNRGNSGNSGNGNSVSGSHSNHHNHPKQFHGGNKMAQKKLQRQARQHANAMDLMSDKAAFLEYVRNQEKKRR